MCRFRKLVLFSFFFCKDDSYRLMKRGSYSGCNFFLRCAFCWLLEVSPVSCMPFVWHFFHSDTHTHTHTHTHTPMYTFRAFQWEILALPLHGFGCNFQHMFWVISSIRLFKVAQNNTFPENVVIFFAQIIIYHLLISGSKKLCEVFGWNIVLEWGRKWALKRKTFVPDTTTRHRNPEECGSLLRQRQNNTEECGTLLRQRQNTKSWSAIVVIWYRIVSKLSGDNYINIPIQCNIFIHTLVSSIH